MNKGIIIIGSVGSGKTYFEEGLCREADFQEPEMYNRLNPDDWVENENNEFYNNPLAASNYMYKTVIPNIMELRMNFILQNTGANVKTLRKIIDDINYQFKIVVVYCNPIIAFKRNFSRERKIPKQIVLENWLKVYSNIEEYASIIGPDNIYIYETEYTNEELEILNKKGGWYISIVKELKTDSTFKKEHTRYSEEQIKQKQEKFKNIQYKIDSNIQSIENQLLDMNRDNIIEQIIEWI